MGAGGRGACKPLLVDELCFGGVDGKYWRGAKEAALLPIPCR